MRRGDTHIRMAIRLLFNVQVDPKGEMIWIVNGCKIGAMMCGGAVVNSWITSLGSLLFCRYKRNI